jgi:hypothetical protein
MPNLRQFVRGLIYAVVVIAIGVMALHNASPDWAGFALLFTCVAHGLSSVGALCVRGRGKPRLLGRALFGWGYLVMVLGAWGEQPTKSAVPTSRLLTAVRPLVGPAEPANLPAASRARPDYASAATTSFCQIGHCLISLAAAALGGVLSGVLFASATTVRTDVPPQPEQGSICGVPRRRLAYVTMILSAFVGLLACAAIIKRSNPCADSAFEMTCGMVTCAALCAVQRRSGDCRPWLGAALFGGGYLLLAFATPVFRDHQGAAILPGVITTADRHDLSTRVRFFRRVLFDEDGFQASNARILRALDQPLDVAFGRDEIPFEDMLERIRVATKSAELPNGIQFYVDPMGLTEVEKTMTSSVTYGLEPGDVTIRAGLEILLQQLELDYFVSNGMVLITDPTVGIYQRVHFDAYQRAGHCIVALLAAVLGCCVARLAGPRSE